MMDMCDNWRVISDVVNDMLPTICNLSRNLKKTFRLMTSRKVLILICVFLTLFDNKSFN